MADIARYKIGDTLYSVEERIVQRVENGIAYCNDGTSFPATYSIEYQSTLGALYEA
jgi:hypothetical protein